MSKDTIKRKQRTSCRTVLWYNVFCGFAVNYILRVNLNLTIVAMVLPRVNVTATVQYNSETFNETYKRNNTLKVASLAADSENVVYRDQFGWNEYEQDLALGAFYWIHWVSQIPGGLLAKRYGTKLVFGLGNFVTSIIGFLIPVMTRQHLYALIFLRVLQGLASGVIWPSMHNMAANWIPLTERSKFVSSYFGSCVGAAISYPLCAALTSTFGWSTAFYVTSSIGVIWYCSWLFFVHDSPQHHPRISEEERKYISDNVSGSVDEKEAKIPWKSICLSRPVWIVIAAQWGNAWSFFTMMTQLPTYLNFIQGWNINATGLISGVPYLMTMFFSYYFGSTCDWLIRTNRTSLSNVRKLAMLVSTGLQGILVLILSYSSHKPILASICIIAGITVNGGISSCTWSNLIDLSPNYASVLLGLCGTVSIFPGFISPAIVGALTNNNQSAEQWRTVFIIAAVHCIVGTIIYLLFGTAKEQPWNKYETSNTETKPELQKLTNVPDPKCKSVKEETNVIKKDKKFEAA